MPRQFGLDDPAEVLNSRSLKVASPSEMQTGGQVKHFVPPSFSSALLVHVQYHARLLRYSLCCLSICFIGPLSQTAQLSSPCFTSLWLAATTTYYECTAINCGRNNGPRRCIH
mmetsp:Transcript_18324/g.39643  ORF Transcript_18324/g.39643 Transcript_18324/m.39643 type:complete len:113 (-) Transcript_18324:2826-3164(-)